MERRFFLALLLSGLVLVVTPMIFGPTRPPTPPVRRDSSAAPAAVPSTPSGAPTAPKIGATPAPASAAPAAPIEAFAVRAGGSEYTFSSLGAAPTGIQLSGYPSLHGSGGMVALRHGNEPLLRYRVISGKDTLRLDQVVFTSSRTADGGGTQSVKFTGASGSARIGIAYSFAGEEYRGKATITVTGVAEPAYLLIGLPTGFDTQEADTLDDLRHLSYAVKPTTRGARGTPFSSLDPGERRLMEGPLSWAVAKNKYFLFGLIAADTTRPFAEAHLVGGARETKLPTRAEATVVTALTSGVVAFNLYAGPQSWSRLHAVGQEFETANPYGGFMQPVVQPFATIVMRVMLWLKQVVRLDYGWVLIIFGVAVRLLMWPLNQSAMRSSLRMQRIQPELQAVQAKHKGDAAKQQQELMRVYKEHGMSPFSAFSGCLPALIPMPVFFALFFVFQNTIEFRGVPFLWLHDISLRDPFFILPIVTGLSMFVMSWIGMRGSPPNPQMQTMLYMMPAMFVVFLLNTASGLSIYYFVQNLAAIPQQWMIANERKKAAPARK